MQTQSCPLRSLTHSTRRAHARQKCVTNIDVQHRIQKEASKRPKTAAVPLSLPTGCVGTPMAALRPPELIRGSSIIHCKGAASLHIVSIVTTTSWISDIKLLRGAWPTCVHLAVSTGGRAVLF
jgi:hypothetical protein